MLHARSLAAEEAYEGGTGDTLCGTFVDFLMSIYVPSAIAPPISTSEIVSTVK
jgi:hypothetical protein